VPAVTVPRMHDDEVAAGPAVARRLLREQAPQWAALPLRQVPAWGTDHAVLRLGDGLSVRLPKIGWAAGQADLERRWLPLLAPHLPVDVPVPLLVGEAGAGYPFRWCVSPWLEGETPEPDDDLSGLAQDLAACVVALQAVPAAGGPPVGAGRRGGPLLAADAGAREAAELLRGEADVDALLAVWEAGVRAPAWSGPPRWS
jgi:aminoglycoside phosphotransferase (APT) family kinase protein